MSDRSDLLRGLLKDVSRSFYLTLRVLPRPIRPQMGLAYLLARAADSIADTDLLAPAERIEKLRLFKQALLSRNPELIDSIQDSLDAMRGKKFVTESSAEEALLRRLPECFRMFLTMTSDDAARIVEVLKELIGGMELDLHRFPADGVLRSLETFDELEQYTYSAAGCVGLFWTRMCCAHLPAFQPWHVKMDHMQMLGVSFGKALQWTNVLRDLPRDLAQGRCYLPARDLRDAGVAPYQLRDATQYPRVEGLYHHYLNHTLEHYRAAWEYTISIPKEARRVRLACIWPIWIGLETLAALRVASNPLDARFRIKISRERVYGIMLRSFFTAGSETMLDEHQHWLVKAAQGVSSLVRTKKIRFFE